jgi:hypothetical protein
MYTHIGSTAHWLDFSWHGVTIHWSKKHTGTDLKRGHPACTSSTVGQKMFKNLSFSYQKAGANYHNLIIFLYTFLLL